MVHTSQPSQADLALELERLDTDLFRSVRLWKPQDGRGVFGGQTMGQAVWAATNTVEETYKLHCYFLSFGDAFSPSGILYHVERLRTGRSYATRYVKAVQNGKTIFALVCSFQVPEPTQTLQSQLVLHPPPEECLNRESILEAEMADPNLSPKVKDFLRKALDHSKNNSVEFRNVEKVGLRDMGRQTEAVPWRLQWVRTKVPIKGGDAFQKCVLTYMSDFQFIGTVARALGIGSGSRKVAMMASLDHMHFYEDVDVSEWMLFYIEVPRAGSGRGLVHGRFYTLDGKLAVVASQEGVVRIQL
ncbi:Thioesterase/thiol ester dehydrase-isomerase [Atractiella rhizophila]|nr:Thioesterase/thiol ester dehydrase-isomerase [Atractiella rhizophila]